MLATNYKLQCNHAANKQQCVFQVDRQKGELTLTELAPGVEVDQVRAKTDAPFHVADKLEVME